MGDTLKDPGVYIVEKDAFPNSVVEVATAVPAFIGYTEAAADEKKSLLMKPMRISSMAEYETYFGHGPPMLFGLVRGGDEAVIRQDGAEWSLQRRDQAFKLYHSMRLFYQNGGGPCYVVSVGDYSAHPGSGALTQGIDALAREQEPTMLVVPDAVLLEAVDCNNVQRHALAHCRTMESRVAILDVPDGFRERTEGPDCVTAFRHGIGADHLDYAAAYYPWLETTVVQDAELSYRNLDETGRVTLQAIVRTELGLPDAPQDPKQEQQAELIHKLGGGAWTEEEQGDLAASEALLNRSLTALSPVFGELLEQMRTRVGLLPPSAAMAGIYTMVDNTRGVWKAPANVSLNGVIRPAVSVSHDEQEDLNVDPQGKSVNAIRSFVGEGTLVWGARTLAGNSLDWRYINVRRTMIMLEQSIRLATKAYVFEANDANTWTTIKSMIRNFMTDVWRRGGLAGATPDEAFAVHVGLGETMTAQDIVDGILRVTVQVAVTRPAEFIEVTFQQQMQES